jgi:regulator of sirC expression with transglutaminase-like and TPR domain
VLDMRGCAELLRSLGGEDAQLEPEHLRSATPAQMVIRMLNNLKQIHLRSGEWGAALACSERILLVDPGQVRELRDRGLLYLELECFAAAQADLERYLALAPDADRNDIVRARLLHARKQAARLN